MSERPKTKLNKWTSVELKELRRVFATASTKDLAAAFPRHSLGSIRATAYDLKLRRQSFGRRKWTAIARNHVPVFGFGRVIYD